MTRSWVEVDTEAIRRNAATMLALAGGAQLCAVVKANAYGHGSVEVSRAALAGGATVLAVAQVGEGVQLRLAGIQAPIWVLSEPEPSEFDLVVQHNLEPVVYSHVGIEAAAAASSERNPLRVHLKVNTGMNRVGAEPCDLVIRAKQIDASPTLTYASVLTHLSTSDEPDNAYTDLQMDRFDEALAELEGAALKPPMVHAANSGGTMVFGRTHHDIVRCGIALYGLFPSASLRPLAELEPALSWKTRVGFVKRLEPGELVNYGLRGVIEHATTLVTVPVGYADGFRRESWQVPGVVLIGGKLRNLVGIVTMDQIVVDVGDDEVAVGDEVVLIGRQGDQEISADSLAEKLGTINYEIVCDIGARSTRVYLPSEG